MPRRLATVLVGLSLLAASPAAWAYSKGVDAAFKGQILVSAAELKAKATDKATIAAFKAQKLKKLPCGFDTAMTPTSTFHVTAFLSSPLSGTSATVAFAETAHPNQAGHASAKLITGLATGATVVQTGVQLTTAEVVGPRVSVTLLGPSKNTLATTELDATCLKSKAASAKP
jgi:hypothetical protein